MYYLEIEEVVLDGRSEKLDDGISVSPPSLTGLPFYYTSNILTKILEYINKIRWAHQMSFLTLVLGYKWTKKSSCAAFYQN